MAIVEAEVLGAFDLDIQIAETDETDLPHRKNAPRAQTFTARCSCTWCCPGYSDVAATCSLLCS